MSASLRHHTEAAASASHDGQQPAAMVSVIFGATESPFPPCSVHGRRYSCSTPAIKIADALLLYLRLKGLHAGLDERWLSSERPLQSRGLLVQSQPCGDVSACTVPPHSSARVTSARAARLTRF